MANNFDNYLSLIQQAKTAGAVEGTADYFNQENRQGVKELTKTPRTGDPLMDSFLRAHQAQANIEAKRELPTSYLDDASAAVSSVFGNTAQTAHGLASLGEIALSAPARDRYIREVQNSEAYKNADPETQQAMLAQAEADMARSEANMYRNIAERSEAIDDVAKGFMTPNAQREMEAAGNRAATMQNIAEQTNASLGDQIGLGIRSAFQNPTQAVHTTAGVLSDFMTGGLVNKGADLAIDATKAGMRAATGYLGRQEARKAAREAGELAQERARDVIAAKADEAAMARRYGDIEREYTNRHLGFNTPNQDEAVARIFGRNMADETAGAQYKAAQEFAKEMAEDARNAAIKESNDEVKGFLKRLGGTTFVESLAKNKILDTAASFTRNPMVRWAGRRLREGAGVGVVEGLQTASEGFGQVQQELDRITMEQFLRSPEGGKLFDEEYERIRPLVDNGLIRVRSPHQLAYENARARAAAEAHTNYMATAPLMNATIQTAMGATVPSIGRALNPLFRGSGAGANLTQAASEVVQEGLSGYGSNELMRRFINPYGGQVSSASGFVAGQEAAGGMIAGAPHAARGSLQAATDLAASAGRGMVKGYRAVRPQKPAPEPQVTIQAQDIPAAPTPEATQRIVDQVVTEAPQDKQTQAQVNSYLQKEMEEATVDFTPSETDNTVVRSQVSTADLDDYEPTSPREAEIKDELSRRLNEYNQEPTTERANNVQKYLDEVGPELSDDFIDITLDVQDAIGTSAAHEYHALIQTKDKDDPNRKRVLRALAAFDAKRPKEKTILTNAEMMEVISDSKNFSPALRQSMRKRFIKEGFLEDTLKEIIDSHGVDFGEIKRVGLQKLLDKNENVKKASLADHIGRILGVLQSTELDDLIKQPKSTEAEQKREVLRKAFGFLQSQEARYAAYANGKEDANGNITPSSRYYLSYNADPKYSKIGVFFASDSSRNKPMSKTVLEQAKRELDAQREVMALVDALLNPNFDQDSGMSPLVKSLYQDIIKATSDKNLKNNNIGFSLNDLVDPSQFRPADMRPVSRQTSTLRKQANKNNVKVEPAPRKSAQKKDKVDATEQNQEAAPQTQPVEQTSTTPEPTADNQEVNQDKEVEEEQQPVVNAAHDNDTSTDDSEPEEQQESQPSNSATPVDSSGDTTVNSQKPTTQDDQDVDADAEVEPAKQFEDDPKDKELTELYNKGAKKPIKSFVQEIRNAAKTIRDKSFAKWEDLPAYIERLKKPLTEIKNNIERANASLYTRRNFLYNINPEKNGLANLSDIFKGDILDNELSENDVITAMAEGFKQNEAEQRQIILELAYALRRELSNIANKSKDNKRFFENLHTDGSDFFRDKSFYFAQKDGLKTFMRVNDKGELELPFPTAVGLAFALEATRLELSNTGHNALFEKDPSKDSLWGEIPDKEKDRLRKHPTAMFDLARCYSEQQFVDNAMRNFKNMVGFKDIDVDGDRSLRYLMNTVTDVMIERGKLRRNYVVYKEREEGSFADDSAHYYLSIPRKAVTTSNGIKSFKETSPLGMTEPLLNRINDKTEDGKTIVIDEGKGINKEWEPTAIYKLHSHTKLTDKDLELLRADAKVKYYPDDNMVDIFERFAFDEDAIIDYLARMMGHRVETDALGNIIGSTIYASSVQSRIDEIGRAVHFLVPHIQRYVELGRPAGFNLRFPSNLTVTGRLQTIEPLSPRNNKTVRAVLTNSKYKMVDASRSPIKRLEQQFNEILSINQAFGKKVEKTQPQKMIDFKNKVARLVKQFVDGIDINQPINSDAVLQFYHANEDTFDKPSMLGFAVVNDLIKRQIAIKQGKQEDIYTFLYTEIDGKTNGAHNLLRFVSSEYTPEKIGALINTGTIFGLEEGASYYDAQKGLKENQTEYLNLLGKYTADIYETTAQVAGNVLKNTVSGSSNPVVRKTYNALIALMDSAIETDQDVIDQAIKTGDQVLDAQLKRGDMKYPTTASNYGAQSHTMARHLLNETEKKVMQAFNNYVLKVHEKVTNNEAFSPLSVAQELDPSDYKLLMRYSFIGVSSIKSSMGEDGIVFTTNDNNSLTKDYEYMFIDFSKVSKNRRMHNDTMLQGEQATKFYQYVRDFDLLNSNLSKAVRDNVVSLAGNAMNEARKQTMGEDVERANNYATGTQNRNTIVARAVIDQIINKVDSRALAIHNKMKVDGQNEAFFGSLQANGNFTFDIFDHPDNFVRLGLIDKEDADLIKLLLPEMQFEDISIPYSRDEQVYNRQKEVSSAHSDIVIDGDKHHTFSIMTNRLLASPGVSGQAFTNITAGDADNVAEFERDKRFVDNNIATVYDGHNVPANGSYTDVQEALNIAVDKTHTRIVNAPLLIQNVELNSPLVVHQLYNLLIKNNPDSELKAKIQKWAAEVNKGQPELSDTNEALLNKEQLEINLFLAMETTKGFDDSFWDAVDRSIKKEKGYDYKVTEKDYEAPKILNLFYDRYYGGVKSSYLEYMGDSGTDIIAGQIALRIANMFAGYHEEQMTAASSINDYLELNGEKGDRVVNFHRKGWKGNYIEAGHATPELTAAYLRYLSDVVRPTILTDISTQGANYPYLKNGRFTNQDFINWMNSHPEQEAKMPTWQEYELAYNKTAPDKDGLRLVDGINIAPKDPTKVEGGNTYDLGAFVNSRKFREALADDSVLRGNQLLNKVIRPEMLKGITLKLCTRQELQAEGIDPAVSGAYSGSTIYLNLDQIDAKPSDDGFVAEAAETIYHELIHAFTAQEIKDYIKSKGKKISDPTRRNLLEGYTTAVKDLYKKLLDNKEFIGDRDWLILAGLTSEEATEASDFLTRVVNENMDSTVFAVEYIAQAGTNVNLVEGLNKLDILKFKLPKKTSLKSWLSKIFGFLKESDLMRFLFKYARTPRREGVKRSFTASGVAAVAGYQLLYTAENPFASNQTYFSLDPENKRLGEIEAYLDSNVDPVAAATVGAYSQVDETVDKMRLAGVSFPNNFSETVFRKVYSAALAAQHLAPQEYRNNVAAVISELSGVVNLPDNIDKVLAQSEGARIPLLLALSQSHPETRAAFTNLKFNNSLLNTNIQGKTNRLDNSIFWLGEKLAQFLDNKSKIKDKNALNYLDSAVFEIAKRDKLKTDSGLTRAMDNANQVVASAVDSALTGAVNVLAGRKGEKISNLAQVQDKALTYAGRHFNQTLLGLVKDIFGRNKTTDAIYASLKRAKTFVQQHRQNSFNAAQMEAEKCFKRELTDSQWATLDNVVGKLNLANTDIDEVVSFIYRPSLAKSELDRINKELSPTEQRKVKDLSDFLMKGEYPRSGSLVKNAYALANLKDPYDTRRSNATQETFERAILLNNVLALTDQDRNTLSDINDGEGLRKIMKMQQSLQRQMQNDIAAAGNVALYNYLEGDMARIKKNERQATVAPLRDDNRMKLLGYHKVTEVSKSHAIYVRDFTPRSVFNQGAIQTIAPVTANVNLYTGINHNPNFLGFVPRNSSPSRYLVPIYSEQGQVLGYEATLSGYNQTEHNLARTIAYNYGKGIERSASDVVNHELLNVVLDMYKSGRKEDFVNVFDLGKKDRIVGRAVNNIPKPFLKEIEAATGKKNFLPVRRDMVNDVIGEHLPSVGDLFTGQTRWSPKARHTAIRFATSILGPKAYQRLVRGEEHWQDTVRAARELIVIKSVAVPFVNSVSNVVQLLVNGVDPLYVAKATPKKLAEVETYVRAQRRIKELRTKVQLGVADGQDAKMLREIEVLNERISNLSIWPLIQRGEFSTVEDVGLSQEDIELLKDATGFIESRVAKMDEGVLKNFLRYGLITRDTPVYQAMQKMTNYSDFIAKAILYDHLMGKGENQQDVLVRIADEFVDYDRQVGRTRGYIESMGIGMFYNYLLRASKAGLRNALTRPLSLLLLAVSPIDIVGAGTPTEDSLLGKIPTGSVNLLGLDNVVAAPTNLPLAQLIL